MSFEQVWEQAYEKKLFGPGAILLAANGDDSFHYEKVIGVRSWAPDAEAKPFDKDTFVRLASCTKLLGTIAAMQCVERGLLELDSDISKVIPELGNKNIVTLNEEGKCVEQPSTKPITLRQLLTHSAGTSYHFFSPAISKWYEENNRDPLGGGTTVAERYNIPLTFEPGTSWAYGVGIDWAGVAVAKVTGQPLQAYMQANIFDPLGIKGITFWPQKHPELMADLAGMCKRDPESGLAVLADREIFLGTMQEEAAGAHAFARVSDYFKVLQSLLRDDEVLLKKETTKTMFTPQLSPEALATLKVFGNIPGAFTGTDGHVDMNKYGLDWGLGGMLCLSDIPGFKGKHTMHWGGLPLLEWWVDRENGLCGFAALQQELTTDVIVDGLHNEFTKGAYAKYNEWKASKA